MVKKYFETCIYQGCFLIRTYLFYRLEVTGKKKKLRSVLSTAPGIPSHDTPLPWEALCLCVINVCLVTKRLHCSNSIQAAVYLRCKYWRSSNIPHNNPSVLKMG